jgi:tRNA G46 methylase TrmB
MLLTRSGSRLPGSFRTTTTAAIAARQRTTTLLLGRRSSSRQTTSSTATMATPPPAAANAKPAKLNPPPRQDPEAVRTIADNRGSPFFELGLAIASAGKGRTRVRQHVNPLRSEFSAPPPPPDWSKLFADPTRPLVVDVGCGQGRFLLLLARRMRQHLEEEEEAQKQQQGQEAAPSQPLPAPSPAVLLPLPPAMEATTTEARRASNPTITTPTTNTTTTTTTTTRCNYLGIEIREPLVERANRWVEMLGLQGDAAFCYANATTALPGGFLDAYPGPLAACLVQFPDPHFKRKHHKRRVLQPALARFLRDRVVPGGCVFLQSDIYAAAAAMRDAMEEWAGREAFELAPQHFAGEGATFEDVGPPADQVRGEPTKQMQKKQKADGDGEKDGGGGKKEQEEDGDDKDGNQTASGAAAFVSEWSRQGGWLSANPIGVPTEREHYVTAGGGSVYRVLLRRRR